MRNNIVLTHEPIWEPIVRAVGNRLVVGYLSHDEFTEDFDGEGRLILEEDALPHLGLSVFGGRYSHAKPDLEIDGIAEELAMVISDRIRNDGSLIPWGVKLRMQLGRHAMEALAHMVLGDDQGIDWTREDLDNIEALGLREELLEKAWRRMYEKGAVGTYLAVPVRFDDYGSNGVRVRSCGLGEANAAWVPDELAIANMNLRDGMSYRDKLAVATKYADGVLHEYEKWCNGEVYGVVVEIFDAETGDVLEHEAVWGFIGHEYAKEELQTSIHHFVARYKRDDATQEGVSRHMVCRVL